MRSLRYLNGRTLSPFPAEAGHYNYLQLLPPAAHRFYELISFQIYAAIKNHLAEAKLRYSEYSEQAPQSRYPTRAQIQKQMYKVHRPHLRSGYIAKVRYEKTTDEQGSPDWFIYYIPGPRARAEFDAFHGRHPRQPVARPRQVKAAAKTEQVKQELLQALKARDVAETVAIELLSGISSEQQKHVTDSLDYWDSIAGNKEAGLLINLIRGKASFRPDYEPPSQRQARQAAEEKRQRLQLEQTRLERAYNDYKLRETERYIAEHLPPDEYEQLVAQHKKVLTDQYSFWQNPERAEELDRLARIGARGEVAKRLTFPSFEEFSQRNRSAPQKPVDEPTSPQEG